MKICISPGKEIEIENGDGLLEVIADRIYVYKRDYGQNQGPCALVISPMEYLQLEQYLTSTTRPKNWDTFLKNESWASEIFGVPVLCLWRGMIIGRGMVAEAAWQDSQGI